MEKKEKSIHSENRFSNFIELIKKDSIDEVKDILQRWPTLSTMRDTKGRTALHYCSEHTSALCADLVLERCPDLVIAQDNDGYTALHLSVISGNQIMTRYLIGKSDEKYVNLCDNESHSAIHWATVCGELQCLDLLLNSGAHPSRADIHGAFPLHYSAQMCSPFSGICIGNDPKIGLTVLNRLLQSPDIDVNCIDSDGRTPLLWAASAELRVSKITYSSGSGDALLALINAGANVSAKDSDGLTALHCSSSRGHIDCVETLLTLCNADIDQMDANGCPPLFYAVTLGHADCTRLLIESGADVNLQDLKGRTAAHCGAARGQIETLKILGQLGANLWIRNHRGDLPFHEAVKSGRKELVKWLLDQIPSAVNSTNSFGRSSLHIAAINNNIEMCKILIDIGADVNTVMKLKGQFITPLDASLQKGYRGVAKYLLLHGALPASRISNANKSIAQRCPSDQRQAEGFIDSPIESYDEWKTRIHTTDSVLHSHPNQTYRMEASKTQLPKLPTLVKHKDRVPESSSSTTSSQIEVSNPFRNMREVETPISDGMALKQAIITNVYVTQTPTPHTKRVPPLKKVKKKRKQLVDNEESKALLVHTPSISSSSSLCNGDDSNIRVILETKDISKQISDKELEEMYLNSKDNQMLVKNQFDVNSEELLSKQTDSNVENQNQNSMKQNSIENEIISENIDNKSSQKKSIKNNKSCDNQKKDSEVKSGESRRSSSIGSIKSKQFEKKDTKLKQKSVNSSENNSNPKKMIKKEEKTKPIVKRKSGESLTTNSQTKSTEIKEKSFKKDKIQLKSKEVKNDINGEQTEEVKNGLEDVDKRDVDSYVKSDNNESVKNCFSSERDIQNKNKTIDGKSEDKQQIEAIDENGDYDKYMDQWDSDSEQTVIDSHVNHKPTEDLNNNYIEKSDESIVTNDKPKGKANPMSRRGSKASDKDVMKSNILSKDMKTKIETKPMKRVVEKNEKSNDNKLPKINDKKYLNKGLDKTKKESEKTVKNLKPNANKTFNSKPKAKQREKSRAKESDMNKTIESKDVLKSSELKTDVIHQRSNNCENESKRTTLFSSEESIFDSALGITGTESEFNTSDIRYAKTSTPLNEFSNTSDTHNVEQLDVCNQYCDHNHKPESRCSHRLHFKTTPATVGRVEVGHIGSKVDSRLDNQYPESVITYNRERMRRVRRVRPSSDGYKSVDPNIITQTVEKSLRKYQLERKLFEELHDLKRFQIRSGRSNEILMVKRLVDKFKKEVKAPGMTDFYGPYSYKNYELYLYDQLRKLSSSNQGKVALITRSVSDENILFIRESNENITQSNPEFTQNTEAIETNEQNINEKPFRDQSYKTNDESIGYSSETAIIDDKNPMESSFLCESRDKLVLTYTECQTDLGNDREVNPNHFDNESESDYHKFEYRVSLEQNDSQSALTSTLPTTHCQNNEDFISQNFKTIEHIILDSNEESKSRQENQFNDIISEREEQNDVLNKDFIQQIADISEEELVLDTKHRIIETMIGEKENCFVESDRQSKFEKSELQSKETIVGQTDDISSTKSTNGSSKSGNTRMRDKYSDVSRKWSLTSIKTIRVSKVDKNRKGFLKSNKISEPLEKGVKQRPKFKRLKMKIPDKHVINISVEDIRKRWKAVKEREMKKVMILYAINDRHNYSFDLWFELNKSFRNNFSTIDYSYGNRCLTKRTSL